MSKRDYYEVLGVARVPHKMKLKKPTENYLKNIIRTSTKSRMRMKNLKK